MGAGLAVGRSSPGAEQNFHNVPLHIRSKGGWNKVSGRGGEEGEWDGQKGKEGIHSTSCSSKALNQCQGVGLWPAVKNRTAIG